MQVKFQFAGVLLVLSALSLSVAGSMFGASAIARGGQHGHGPGSGHGHGPGSGHGHGRGPGSGPGSGHGRSNPPINSPTGLFVCDPDSDGGFTANYVTVGSRVAAALAIDPKDVGSPWQHSGVYLEEIPNPFTLGVLQLDVSATDCLNGPYIAVVGQTESNGAPFESVVNVRYGQPQGQTSDKFGTTYQFNQRDLGIPPSGKVTRLGVIFINGGGTLHSTMVDNITLDAHVLNKDLHQSSEMCNLFGESFNPVSAQCP